MNEYYTLCIQRVCDKRIVAALHDDAVSDENNKFKSVLTRARFFGCHRSRIFFFITRLILPGPARGC